MEKNEFLDKLAAGTMTRRDFNKALSAAGLATVTMPFVPGAARAAGEINYFTWGGYDIAEIHQPYLDKYDGPPAYSLFGEEEEAMQKMRAGFAPDISHPCINSVPRWYDAGILQPIDISRIPSWPNIWDELQDMKGSVVDGRNYFVPFDWGNSSILYRTDLVDPEYLEEESWGILLDERYKGRMAVYDSVDAIAGITGALIGAADAFNMTDAELVEARKVLEKIHGNMRFWWTDQTAVEQALASGEMIAGYAWNSAVVTLKKEGIPIKYMNPKEGILFWVCGLVRIADAPGSEDAAYDFMEAMLDPESGRFLIDEYGYGHANTKSFDLVSAERLDALGISSPSALFAEGWLFDEIAPDIREKLITMFEEVKAGF
ncbi:MAG: extracellular solute-binding protein [Rhodospirillales bacterium]|jgi:spermidine/putrescine-binding protein|nr:extracellular solute-binding protein [Rhodospirillales bacterium]